MYSSCVLPLTMMPFSMIDSVNNLENVTVFIHLFDLNPCGRTENVDCCYTHNYQNKCYLKYTGILP